MGFCLKTTLPFLSSAITGFSSKETRFEWGTLRRHGYIILSGLCNVTNAFESSKKNWRNEIGQTFKNVFIHANYTAVKETKVPRAHRRDRNSHYWRVCHTSSLKWLPIF